MKTLRILTAFSMLIGLFISACTSESAPLVINADHLQGQWNLESAARNDKPTSSLEGTFMNFNNGKMKCNFTGEEVETDFSVLDNQVSQNNQTYSLDSLAGSTLVVSTKYMDFDFKLKFKKEK